MHTMLNPFQFAHERLAPARCLAEIDRAPSERGYDSVEPTAHGLFAFHYLHRAKYQLNLVKLA